MPGVDAAEDTFLADVAPDLLDDVAAIRQHEVGVEVRLTHQIEDRAFEVRVGNHDPGLDLTVAELVPAFAATRTDRATQIMLHVHKRGIGVAGVYTREIAESRIGQVDSLARRHEFPLRCSMEEA